MFTHPSLIGTVLGVALLAAVVGGPACADSARIALTGKDLYGGFDARKVLPDAAGRLVLDERVFKVGRERKGWVVTDPIDLGPADGIVGRAAMVRSVAIAVSADVPEGAHLEVEARSGATMLDTAGWSEWRKLGPTGGEMTDLAGRYVQLRLTLTATAADKLPAISGVTLTPTVEPGPAWSGKLAVTEADIQNIVRSPIEFKYERPDQESVVWLRQVGNLDQVVAGANSDFEQLVALMDWAGGLNNPRGTRRERDPNGRYCWNIRKIIEVGEDGKLNVHGHCMSYAEVLATAATSFGHVSARHLANVGFRQMSHETVEVWVPSLGKWVYLDPSLTQYYFDKDTKVPLNMIEMHRIVVDNFVPEGKTVDWLIQRQSEETRAVVRRVGGQRPIGARTGPWRYGEPMAPDYDWGWSHGYLAAGRVQMTPRNDFHSNPDAVPGQFEHSPGYAGYPNWVDEKTPPYRGGDNWFTRMRDFYWTLDQASVRLVQAGEGVLRVELGQSMPFFKGYRLKVDSVEVKAAASPFAWKLNEGVNRLEVAPVDEFGKVGLSSRVTVNYSK